MSAALQRKLWLVAALFAALFFSLGFRLHGYSLMAWRNLIDGSPPKEIWFGQAQAIRSDDFLVGLPWNLSQSVQDPVFPVVNPSIGYGQEMLVLGPPMIHWSTFFRPTTWGYFFGDDFGLAFSWTCRWLFLLFTLFLLFDLLTRQSFWISLLGSLVILYSPFFAFWSHGPNKLVATGILTLYGALQTIGATSRLKTTLYGLLTAWSGVGFFLSLYPPHQIPLAYLLLAIFLGFVMERPETRSGRQLAWRWLNLAAALALCLSLCFLFWKEAANTFQLLSQTAYPGARKVAGGTWEAWKLFSNYLLPFRNIREWGPLANICEASFFYYLFPLLAPACLLSYRRFRANALVWAVLAFVAGACLWILVGFPGRLSSLLLFDRVLEQRAALALGIADVTLTVLYLSRPAEYRSKWLKRIGSFLLLLGWAVFLTWVGSKIRQNFETIPTTKLIFAGVGFLALGAALFFRKKVGLVILLAISVVTTYWFNPVTQGGTQFIRNNPLSLKILDLDKQVAGGSTWVSFNELGLSNLFRMLGVRALSGVHFYPQFPLWEKLDPSGQFRDVYNRYAHVSFILSDDKSSHRISNPSPDTIHLNIHPEDPAFAKLGVDFIVFTGPRTELLDRSPLLQYLGSQGDKHLYRFLKSPGVVTDQQDGGGHR